MIKKYASLLAAIVALMCFSSATAYAKEYNIDGIRIQVEDTSVLLPDGVDHSSDEVHNPMRGSIIASAMTSVDNDGNGDMTFRIDTLAYVACDEIRHKAFVEVWDEAADDWNTIETVLFVADKDMTPDEALLSLNNSFTVKKLEVGKYYRLTGLHLVRLDMDTEQFASSTDGVKNEIH